MKRKQEAEFATFRFGGGYDKISAKLKKALEIQKATFDASVKTPFKPKLSAKCSASRSAPLSPRD